MIEDKELDKWWDKKQEHAFNKAIEDQKREYLFNKDLKDIMIFFFIKGSLGETFPSDEADKIIQDFKDTHF